MGSSLQEIVRSEEKYTDLLERSGELQSLSLDDDTQMELTVLHQAIERIKSNLQELEVIKKGHEGDNKVREMFMSLSENPMISY